MTVEEFDRRFDDGESLDSLGVDGGKLEISGGVAGHFPYEAIANDGYWK